jgi:salicylate hydroxylase
MAAPLNIAIVGGGIGGLFTANALIAQNASGADRFKVSVYEQAPALGEIGAGVYLTPNSVRQLDRVGLGPAVEKYGARVGSASRYFRHDGTPIAPVRVTDSAGWNATFGMHRADFVEFLSKALPDGVVNCGHRCTGFADDDGVPRLSFANGASAVADLVIAADGIHSVLRPYVTAVSTPVFSGSTAYRGTVPHERVPHWPTDSWQMWLGKGKHFLVFPLRAGKVINYVGFVPADTEMKESWTAPGDPAMLRQEFAGWDPKIGTLLREVQTTFRWALYDRDPIPVWTRNRLTLLGDAAHPMLPHLGQGANQSIEDGMALSIILAQYGSDRVPDALNVYETLRRQRVADVQLGARQNGMRYDSAYGDLGVRDAEIAAHADFRRRLYDYDVVREIKSAAGAAA